MNDLIISREAAAHRGRRLEYLHGAGMIAGSVSLIGFGIGGLIEVTSGATLLWRMSVDADAARRERNERLSLRIVGACFLALALYVGIEAVLDLGRKAAPERSVSGMPLAVVSPTVMPVLSRATKSVGNALSSAAMKADARRTDFCVYLSAILLVGVVLNATLGSWADPLASADSAWDDRPGDPSLKVRQKAQDLRSTSEFMEYAVGNGRRI